LAITFIILFNFIIDVSAILKRVSEDKPSLMLLLLSICGTKPDITQGKTQLSDVVTTCTIIYLWDKTRYYPGKNPTIGCSDHMTVLPALGESN